MYMHDCFFLLSAVHLRQLLSQLQRVFLSYFLPFSFIQNLLVLLLSFFLFLPQPIEALRIRLYANIVTRGRW